MVHVKMIRKDEAKNGFNPMTSDEFLKDEPWGWVICKGGDIAVFAGVKTPTVFPSKEAAEDAGYVLNESTQMPARKKPRAFFDDIRACVEDDGALFYGKGGEDNGMDVEGVILKGWPENLVAYVDGKDVKENRALARKGKAKLDSYLKSKNWAGYSIAIDDDGDYAYLTIGVK